MVSHVFGLKPASKSFKFYFILEAAFQYNSPFLIHLP
jgi:hypothetical protein